MTQKTTTTTAKLRKFVSDSVSLALVISLDYLKRSSIKPNLGSKWSRSKTYLSTGDAPQLSTKSMQYSTKRIWRKHKLEISFGAIALVAAFFSHGDIQRSMHSVSEDRARIASNASEQRRLEENAELIKAKAAIAEQRYKDGCTIVVAANSPKNLATLVLGEPVLDRTTKKPLPAGTVVCDGNGTTAVLASNSLGVPVVSDIAFTGNRKLALDLIRNIRGARVDYYMPQK